MTSKPQVTGIKCTAQRNNGLKCDMNRMKDSAYCYTHDPAIAEERREARSRGQSRRFVAVNHKSSARLETLKDVKKRYAEIFNELKLVNGDPEIKKNAEKMIQALKGFTEAYEKEISLEKLEEITILRASLSPEKSVN